LAGINILGVKFGAGLMRWLTALKLGSLATITLYAIIFRLGDVSNFTPFFDQRSGSEPLMGALPGAMIAAFFSFAGWWNLSKLAAEVRDPYRILSRALFFGVLIVTLVYVVTSAVFIYLMPIQGVTSGETFAAQAGEKLFGKAGAAIFSSIVMVSIFGSLAAVMMSAPRVYFAMSRDRLFFKHVAELHPRFSTPARAILLQAALSCLLVALGTFNQIIAYFVFVTVLFVALTVAAVFILPRRDDDRNLFRTVGYPLTPALFIVLVVILLFLLAATNPKQAFLGASVVALGLPVYYFFLRRARLTMRRGDKGALST
jgi:basic amino acid/polyamine antiporter, APA family